MINTETIKCGKCGWDTKIGTGPIHLYIPAPGVKCPNCNTLIISVAGVYLKDKDTPTIENIWSR